MSPTAPINGQEFTVAPRTRLEALATHSAAHRYTGSAVIAAAFALFGTGYATISQWSAPASPEETAAITLGLVFNVLALALGIVVHRRLQTLQANPGAWVDSPSPAYGAGRAPAPWGVVLRVPWNAWIGVTVAAALWLLGTLLLRTSAPVAQTIGGVALLPGAVVVLLVSVVGVWMLFSAFVYMLWNLAPMSAAQEPTPNGGRR